MRLTGDVRITAGPVEKERSARIDICPPDSRPDVLSRLARGSLTAEVFGIGKSPCQNRR